jgi:hypothetical protein
VTARTCVGCGENRTFVGRTEQRVELAGDRGVAGDGPQRVAVRERSQQLELFAPESAREMQDHLADLAQHGCSGAHTRGGRCEHVVVVGPLGHPSPVRAIEVDDVGRPAVDGGQRGELGRRERAQLGERVDQRCERGGMAGQRRQPRVSVGERGAHEHPLLDRAHTRRDRRREVTGRQPRDERRERDELCGDEPVARQRPADRDRREGRWHNHGDRSERIALLHAADERRQLAPRGVAVRREQQTRPHLHHHADST